MLSAFRVVFSCWKLASWRQNTGRRTMEPDFNKAPTYPRLFSGQAEPWHCKLITGIASCELQKAAATINCFATTPLSRPPELQKGFQIGLRLSTSLLRGEPLVPLTSNPPSPLAVSLLVPSRVSVAFAATGRDSTGAVFFHAEERLLCWISACGDQSNPSRKGLRSL